MSGQAPLPPVLWAASSEDLVDQQARVIQSFNDHAPSPCSVLRPVMGAREAKGIMSRPVSKELTAPGQDRHRLFQYTMAF